MPIGIVADKILTVAGLAGLGYVTALMWLTGPISIADPVVPYIAITGMVTVAIGLAAPWLARRTDQVRPSLQHWIANAGEGVVATGVIALLLVTSSVATAVLTPHTATATADWALAWLELALDYTYISALMDSGRMGLIPVLLWVYGSLALQIRSACAWWSFIGNDASPLWEAAALMVICVLVGLPMYMALPTTGPAYYYGTGNFPSWFEPWRAMREGDPYVLLHLDGFIGAPSFHIIFTALLVRLWWFTPMRLASLLINGVMVWATWVIGGHYLTDMVLGGMVVAFAWIVLQVVRRFRWA